PQNDVTLKMPAFEWVHVQLHQQKGMISLSPPTICNSASQTATGNGINGTIRNKGQYAMPGTWDNPANFVQAYFPCWSTAGGRDQAAQPWII
ncbi:hypothetical protein, partial [Klebsiella pneumoniae]